MRGIRASSLLFNLSLLLASAGAGAQYSVEGVALDGDPFPLGGTFVSARSSDAALNDHGTLTFTAEASSGTHYVMVRDADGTLSARVASGDTAPDTAGATFYSFSNASLNDSGQLAFTARLAGLPPPGGSGIFRESGGMVTAAAVAGDPAPDLAPALYYLGSTVNLEPSIGQNGDVAFFAPLDVPPWQGIFVDSGGTDSKVVAPGDTAPDTGGASFSGVEARAPFVSDLGDVMFFGRFSLSGRGIFSASGGSSSALFLSITSPAGGFFGDMSLPKTNASGQTLFLTGAEAGTSNEDAALLVSSGGVESVIVSSGDPAPGGVYNLGFSPYAINDHGDVAFISRVGGNWGIYVFQASTGTITRVVQTGDPVPGAAGETFSFFRTVSINRDRQVAFYAAELGFTGVFLASPQPWLPALGHVAGAILAGLVAATGGLAAARYRRRP